MRKRRIALAFLVGHTLLASAALAAPGLRLSWDHCAADGLVANKAFACDTNAGSQILVGSFELAAPVPFVTGLEMAMDFASTSDAVPAWWQFVDAANCRSTALTLPPVPPIGTSACIDLLGDTAAGGLGSYTTGLDGPNIARLTLATVGQGVFDANAGVEYFAFGLAITNQKTVGAAACGGCSKPMCIGLAEVRVHTSVTANDVNLLGGPESGVTWQGAQFTQYVVIRRPSRANSTITCLAAGVPTRRETWGAVKSLYH